MEENNDSSSRQARTIIKKSLFKRWWFWVILVVVVFALMVLGMKIMDKQQDNFQEKQKNSQTEINKSSTQAETKNATETFATEMFDSSLVKNILPLGELNGGYEETQTLNGLMIITKSDLPSAPDMEVKAPADMKLVSYSHHQFRTEPEAWRLEFQIDENLSLTFDHITKASQKIIEKTTSAPKSDSRSEYPKEQVEVKAGEIIGYTTGKGRQKSFNLYFYDKRTKNQFVNQARFEARGQAYLTASCVLDHYEDPVKDNLYKLLGYDEPGQSKTCGSVSRDVKGTLSGLWFLTSEGIESGYEGNYGTPFSMFKASSNDVILYEINHKRYMIGVSNKTYKDPATITDSHCYNLTEYRDDRQTKGYTFFKVISNTEMKMSYNPTGKCPAQFPEAGAKNYYR